MLDRVLLDGRHALRALRHNPGFTAIAIVVLALGIGLNSTVFSVLNAVLLKPLPLVPEPDRIAWISRVLSYDEFRRVNDRQRVFSSFAAFSGTSLNVSSGVDEGEVVRAQVVTDTFFDVFGVHPALGRRLTAADVAGAHPVVVVSDRLWRRRFDPERSPIGANVALNGLPFTIVGVMPAGFVDEVGLPHDAWVPITVQPQLAPGRRGEASMLASPDTRWLNIAGRLKAGVSLRDAERGIQPVLYADNAPRFPGDRDREVALLGMSGGLDPRDRREAAPIGAILMALVSLVLLVACANVANLLLARGTERRREMAIRRALGAGRSRIVSQLLIESAMLALAAGAAGALLTLWIADLLRTTSVTSAMTLTWDLTPDRRVVTFTFVASLVSAVAAGLVPALQTSRPAIAPGLHNELIASGRGYRRSRLRGFFVGAQVALSLMLLVGAALLVRSLLHVSAIDPGIDPNGRILLTVNVGHHDEARGRAIFGTVLKRLASDRTIASAALVTFPPLTQSGSSEWNIAVDGREPSDADVAGVNIVSPRYFETLSVAIVRGRPFSTDDRAGAEPVAIVNQAIVERYWHGENPLGRRIRLGGVWRSVVGVARDGKYHTLADVRTPQVYLPFAQHYESTMTVVAKAAGGLPAAVAAMRSAVQSVDRSLPVLSLRTYTDAIDISYLPARAAAIALSAFGLLALALATAGVYGVLSYTVSRRRHEIGVRVALGGQPGDVVRLVVGDALRSVATGSIVGLVLAAAAAPLARSALYGLSPLDPVAFVTAALILAVCAAVAAFVPARRAVRVDAAVALREE